MVLAALGEFWLNILLVFRYAHAFLWDSGSSVGTLTELFKKANSVDIRKVRPYRCAVASDDFKTYFYEGPPFKKGKDLDVSYDITGYY